MPHPNLDLIDRFFGPTSWRGYFLHPPPQRGWKKQPPDHITKAGVRRGGYGLVLLCLVRTLVAEVHDAGTERACLDQPEIDRRVQWRKEGYAASKDDRLHEQPVFVDQAELHEGCREGGTAEVHIVARLRFEPGDLVRDVVAHQARIPVDLIERLREDNLGLALPDAGELDLDRGVDGLRSAVGQ